MITKPIKTYIYQGIVLEEKGECSINLAAVIDIIWSSTLGFPPYPEPVAKVTLTSGQVRIVKDACLQAEIDRIL